ncbi:MAG: glycosyltransferase family 2 protein [Treponema sp.]|nr:glycosyltransferase family 2 protein [Treponema sp.]
MISIAMTTFNGEKYLGEQIDSILSQSYKEFELVVCDDCSTDNTVKILREYEKKNSRVHVYENEKNLGFKKNFEKAVGLCTGDFIAFADQDDVWLNDHLEILFSKIGDKDCIGGGHLNIDSEGNEVFTSEKKEWFPESRKEAFFFVLNRNIFQGSAMLLRKEVCQKYLSIPENVFYHDWWFALCAAGQKGIIYTSLPVLKYRRHNNSVTFSNEVISKKARIKRIFNNADIREEKILLETVKEYFKIAEEIDKPLIHKVIDYREAYINGKIKCIFYYIKHFDLWGYGNKMQRLVVFIPKVINRLFRLIAIRRSK